MTGMRCLVETSVLHEHAVTMQSSAPFTDQVHAYMPGPEGGTAEQALLADLVNRFADPKTRHQQLKEIAQLQTEVSASMIGFLSQPEHQHRTEPSGRLCSDSAESSLTCLCLSCWACFRLLPILQRVHL